MPVDSSVGQTTLGYLPLKLNICKYLNIQPHDFSLDIKALSSRKYCYLISFTPIWDVHVFRY